MHFRVFTLHPRIFDSFLQTALIARAIEKQIIAVDTFNWRDEFGLGNYRQIDDTPFGGGSGMVLMVEPIFRAMNSVGVVSPLFRVPDKPTEHRRVLPNNSQFYKLWLDRVHTQPLKKISISLTPRGFPVNQEIIEWLAEFEEINLLAGRYEGFDNRAAELVDLELSLGNFVLNGGEVPSMALIEGVARLVPGFVGKERCTGHDSFSSSLNYYRAEEEFFIGKRRMSQFVNKHLFEYEGQVAVKEQLFDDEWWLANIAPHIEHPHYTRPENWQNFVIPEFLKTGKHKLIQDWRMNWWKN